MDGADPNRTAHTAKGHNPGLDLHPTTKWFPKPLAPMTGIGTVWPPGPPIPMGHGPPPNPSAAPTKANGPPGPPPKAMGPPGLWQAQSDTGPPIPMQTSSYALPSANENTNRYGGWPLGYGPPRASAPMASPGEYGPLGPITPVPGGLRHTQMPKN